MMLVLTRKTGESIWIGNAITVKVLHVQNGNFLVGIEAPKSLLFLLWYFKKKIINSNKN